MSVNNKANNNANNNKANNNANNNKANNNANNNNPSYTPKFWEDHNCKSGGYCYDGNNALMICVAPPDGINISSYHIDT